MNHWDGADSLCMRIRTDNDVNPVGKRMRFFQRICANLND